MGCAFCKPMAAVTLTTARWDDAAVGQQSGNGKIAIPPDGARRVHIVTAATLYIAMDSRAEVYAPVTDAALNEDGAPLYANNAADRAIYILPVPVGATYLHLKGAGATSVTFYG